jgi:hypothetical protein
MLWLLLGCVHAPPEAHAPPVVLDLTPTGLDPGLSDAVARVMGAYPRDGSYGFYWPPDDGMWWGTTRDLWYLGVLISPGDPEHRSHCVGLTWEVAMTVLSEAVGGPDQPINGLSVDDLATFRTDWFVREVGGAGAADALAHFGLGQRVVLGDVRRGDFLQMWAVTGMGHSGIFDRWVRDADGNVLGVRYWSTHPALGGIGYTSEGFGPLGLDPEQFYAARVWKPADWKPWGVGGR